MAKDIRITFAPEYESKSKDELSKFIEAKAEEYSRLMVTSTDWKVRGPLHSSEKALIMGFLAAALTGKLDNI